MGGGAAPLLRQLRQFRQLGVVAGAQQRRLLAAHEHELAAARSKAQSIQIKQAVEIAIDRNRSRNRIEGIERSDTRPSSARGPSR
eukprot:3428051-Pyramimonas_sp.AAC.1